MRTLVVAVMTVGSAAWGQQRDPFTPAERVRHYLYRTYSWQRMSLLGADTGLDSLVSGADDWGSGGNRYGRRYAYGFGQRVVRNTIELGLGIALREDARHKPSGKPRFRARLWYASTHSVLASTPGGRYRPAYSRLAAAAITESICGTWMPYRRGPGDVLTGVGFHALGELQNSLLSEFEPDLKRFGLGILNRVRRR